MGNWPLTPNDLKRYPHFDAWITASEATALATDPTRVASHTFYPFIYYIQGWNRFAKKGKSGKRKERKIRYAARGDAYILAYYRHILSSHYEAALVTHSLQNSIIAYRKIPEASGTGGKCNIHFARDAFLKIAELGNCCVIALDISNFFENLDHERLYQLWCRMLGVAKLPKDHLKVFRAVVMLSSTNRPYTKGLAILVKKDNQPTELLFPAISRRFPRCQNSSVPALNFDTKLQGATEGSRL